MNYFAHATLVLALNRPLTTAGAMLPDLLRYVGVRRGHVRIDVDGLAATSSVVRRQVEDVACGAESHLRADAAFHASETFGQLLRDLNRFICAGATQLADHWTRWLLPHIAVEIILDRMLVRADPEGAEACYAAMRLLRDCEALPPVCENYRASPAAVRALLTQWIGNRRLHSYDTFEGVLTAVERTLARCGRRVIADDQTGAFAALLDHAERLIADPYRLLPSDCLPLGARSD